MADHTPLSRRSVLLGAAAGAAGAAGAAAVTAPAGSAFGAAAAAPTPVAPLWKTAGRRGLLYGSSTATWQLDAEYTALFRRHAAILFTEDDLLWYQLKPTPTSPLTFATGDKIITFAEDNDQLVFGAHLVWDEGFGDGWKDSDLYDLDERQARHLLFDTLRAVVGRYRGRVAIWSVVNEAIVNGTDQGYQGLRKNYPWFQTIGPEYVGHAFHEAHATDPAACLVLNDFGYETTNEYGDRPIDKMRATLKVIDRLLDQRAPVHAFGIQGHLLADRFKERFNAKQYRAFLAELAARGLKIFVTEMDVLDDGLPKGAHTRDRLVADVYHRYLDVALEEPDVAAVISFGLSDRWTWLDEDYPRDDGAHRRPLAFNASMAAKPAYRTIRNRLHSAPRRWPTFDAPRHVPTTRRPTP